MEAKSICSSCEKNDAEPSHTCPFKDEIAGDSETLCNCCSECEYKCCMDI